MGGLSGPAIRPIAVRMVWECFQAVKLPIIGMGGIATISDALEFIIAGASAVQVGTANFVDPFIWGKLIAGLDEYMTRHRLAHVERPGRHAAHRHKGSRMNRILVALDVPTAAEAIALADTLRGAVAGFKIGSQLFTAAGPDVVRTLVSHGDRVFLDLKFHDIPNTVAGAVRSACQLGVWMVNVHASGGRPMMEAARRAADEAAPAAGTRPIVIAVTVLTSLRSGGIGFDRHRRPRRRIRSCGSPNWRRASGLDGVVASPQETAAIRAACGPDFVIVTPGIRGGRRAVRHPTISSGR